MLKHTLRGWISARHKVLCSTKLEQCLARLHSHIQASLGKLTLRVMAGQAGDEAQHAHAQKVIIGLRSPDGHPVSQPCIPVRAALLHLLRGEQDSQPPCSLQETSPQCQSV
jgi:hypothetical protein